MSKEEQLCVGQNYYTRDDNTKVKVVHISEKAVFYEGVSSSLIGSTFAPVAFRTLSSEEVKIVPECQKAFINWIEFLDKDEKEVSEDEKNHWLDGFNWARRHY
jgi:hypothetical protein